MTTTTPTDIEALCERAMNSVARIATVQNAPAQVWQAHVLAVKELATALRTIAGERDAQRRRAEEAEAERDEARRELEHFRTSGIIEVAVRNPSVSEYMDHWEGRAEAAEADRDRLSERVAELERLLEPFGKYASFRDQAIGDDPDDLSVISFAGGLGRDAVSVKLTLGHFRAARDWIATKEKTDADHG